MGFDLSVENYRGNLVIVKPVYGWGWAHLDTPEIPVPAQINGVPYPFSCRIQHFFYWQNELRGAVAEIEEPDRIYDRLQLIFSPRVTGTHNFINQLAYCDIQIGSVAPVGEWPEIISGSPIINGYGFVGESLEHIESFIISNSQLPTT
jgi:hypothetical protein